ncbi:MAG: MFS transporter [Rhodospirillales bacterium]|nr:MFS transporter [Rhodospirillales bacterium]
MATLTTSDGSSRLALAFSCVGHAYSHLFAPIFFIVVLALEQSFSLSHGSAVSLIIAGNMLFGLAAPLAGWLGDRWSATGMMALFFLGTGGGLIATGFAADPVEIGLGLAATGTFASIYHPVGMAWLVRNARSWGKALGINGVFGSLGPAAAALSAGALIDYAGWRAAFIVPGAVVVATGVLFCALIACGAIVEVREDRAPAPRPARGDAARAFIVLSLTMLCSGLIYQATQPALPKLLFERAGAWIWSDGGAFGVSMLVSLVYLASGACQILAGHLADRFPMKRVYVCCFAAQVPVLLLASTVGGGPIVAVAMLMVCANVGALPAENGLVALYAPAHRRGFAYGLKFVLAFGVSGLGVQLEGMLYDATGGFVWLFTVLASLAAVGFAAACLLPAERASMSVAAPAQ